MLFAVADDVSLFDCVTEPSLPGLRTRIGAFVLLAPDCSDAENAPACWVLSAFWIAAWIGELEPHPHDGPPAAVCVEVWCAVFALVEVACESTEFVCDTDPLLPGLRTRTDTLLFCG